MANLRVGTGITFDGATGNFNAMGIGTVRGAFNATGTITATSVTATTYTGITSTSLPAGTVLQSVGATYSTTYANTTATYADTGLSASITISANSKVLILVTQPLEMKQTAAKMRGDIRLMRGSTEI